MLSAFCGVLNPNVFYALSFLTGGFCAMGKGCAGTTVNVINLHLTIFLKMDE